MLTSCADSAGHLSFLPQSLSVSDAQPYTGAYEESISDTTSYTESARPDQPGSEAPSIERGNTLLTFQPPTYNLTLLDYSLRPTSLSVNAQLHGMFFLAESLRSPVGDGPAPPAELTCYRRNLFQITGSVTLPRGLRYIVSEQGDRIPILTQELCISATESVEGSPVKIISIPWKTPVSSSGSGPEDKSEKEPNSVPLDTISNQSMNADYVTFPVAWKRLQFRVATANNGRRKELQQHFNVKLSVVATLSTGTKVSVSEAVSGAIIVRGRSPRNFQQRKDYPLSGSGGSLRKGKEVPPPFAQRVPKGVEVPRLHTQTSPSIAIPLHLPTKMSQGSDVSPTGSSRHTSNGNNSPNAAFTDWRHHSNGTLTALSTPTMTSTPNSPALPVYESSSPDLNRLRKPSRRTTATTSPTIDPEFLANECASPHRFHKVARTRTTTSPTKVLHGLPSQIKHSSSYPLDTVNPFHYHATLQDARLNPSGRMQHGYDQYDWNAQGDVVYRPHAVQQTIRPSLIQNGMGGPDALNCKRGFTEDMS